MKQHIALSGQMCAGKDHVIKTTQFKTIGFADPIYELTEYLCGTRDKGKPGVRETMQKLGQYGWGCVSNLYPLSAERGLLELAIRNCGNSEMTKTFSWVDWSEFGKRKDFWVNILLTRLSKDVGQRYAVTNARFDHELQPLMNAGCAHYHVMTTEETRLDRMRAAGLLFSVATQQDSSEQLALQLNNTFDPNHTVWNDHQPMPAGKRYLTVEEFHARIAE